MRMILPKSKALRIKRKFLFLPVVLRQAKTFEYEKRWLEWAYIRVIYSQSDDWWYAISWATGPDDFWPFQAESEITPGIPPVGGDAVVPPKRKYV